MAGLAPLCAYRADGGVAVNRDYSLRFADDRPGLPKVFLNGLCESSHGFGDAGSFSLLSLRSAEIVESLERALTDANGSIPATPARPLGAVSAL